MLCIKCMYFTPQWKVLTFKCVFVFGHTTKSQNNTGSLVLYSLFMHLELRMDIMWASMQHWSKRNVEQKLISILANDDFTVCRLEVGRFVLYKRVHLTAPLQIGVPVNRDLMEKKCHCWKNPAEGFTPSHSNMMRCTNENFKAKLCCSPKRREEELKRWSETEWRRIKWRTPEREYEPSISTELDFQRSSSARPNVSALNPSAIIL